MRFSPLQRRGRALVRAIQARLAPFGLRRRTVRYLRIAAAYALTIGFLAVVGLVATAALSRTTLPAPRQILELEPGRSTPLQAVERIFALPDEGEIGADEALLFAPPARAARAAAFKRGAVRAARNYLATIDVVRGARRPVWTELRTLVGAGADAPLAAATARLNEAVAREEIVLRTGRAAYGLALDAAAIDCTSAASGFSAALARARLGGVDQADETSFHEARGAAYGWALILAGVRFDDGGETTAGDYVSALYEAGAYQPLFLSNAPADAALSPNHFTHLAFRLDRAAEMMRGAAR